MKKCSDWKQEYFSLLRRSGLDDQALAWKRQHLPVSLYRYRNYDSKDEKGRPHSLSGLRTDTVWLSSPLDFNDPFDSSFSISYDRLTARFVHDLFRQWERVCRDAARALTRDEADDVTGNFDAFVALLANKGVAIPRRLKERLEGVQVPNWGVPFRDGARELVKHHRDSLRICCFSEEANSILMWSHYACHHKGYCLEYSTESFLDASLSLFRLLHPVNYGYDILDATEYLRRVAKGEPPNVLLPTIAACRKSAKWRYEREWRLVVPGGIGNNEQQFPFPRPVGLILGARTETYPDHETELRTIAKEKGIKVFQASLAENEFRIEIKPAPP